MSFQFNNPPVIPYRQTSDFGRRNTGIVGASTDHKGIDAGRDKSKLKTAVLSVSPGKVILNEWNAYRGWNIIIRHQEKPETIDTRYQHLESKSHLAISQSVQAGEIIGIMGASCDPKKIKDMSLHLHFEVIINGVPRDPEPWIRDAIKRMEEAEEVEQVYITVEEIPEAFRDKVKQYVKDGIIKGDQLGHISLTLSQIRNLIFTERMITAYAGK